MERYFSANLWTTLRLDNYVVYILCGIPPLKRRVFGGRWGNQCVGGDKIDILLQCPWATVVFVRKVCQKVYCIANLEETAGGEGDFYLTSRVSDIIRHLIRTRQRF